MKRSIFFIALLIVVFIARQLYTLSDGYIKQQHWLYGGGYHFSDGFSFDAQDNIINDTIYMNKKSVAVIHKRVYRPFIANYLVLKSPTSKEFGTYHEK